MLYRDLQFTQFMLCASLQENYEHAKRIAKCFVKQRYKDKKIQKWKKEVANMSRESLPNVNP